MSNFTKQLKEVSAQAVADFQKGVKAGWINSIVLIYEFYNTYSRDAVEAKLASYNLKITGNANEFTAVCKLGCAEASEDGKSWVVSDVQVSRYSDVCEYLVKHQVKPDEVHKFLEGKTQASILEAVSGKSGGGGGGKFDQKRFDASLQKLQHEFNNAVVVNNVLNLSNFNVKEGANLMVVVADENGNVVGVECAKGSYKDLMYRIATGGEKAKQKAEPETPLTEEEKAEQEAEAEKQRLAEIAEIQALKKAA